MRKIFSLLLFAVCVSQGFEHPVPAQAGEPVQIRPGFLASTYLQAGQIVEQASLYDIVNTVPAAHSDVIQSKVWLYSGLGVAGAGGFLFGFSLGQSLGGGGFNAPVFWTGAGLIATGLVFTKIADTKLGKAVEAYNKTLPAPVGLQWNLAPGNSSAALTFRF